MSYVTDKFKTIASIIPTFAVTTTNIVKPINGKACTVNVLSGAVWINPNTVATTTNGIKITGAIDLKVVKGLNLISDATGATVQIIVWGD